MVDVLLILPHICLLSFLRDEQINALFWKVSQTRHGSRICRVHFQWMPLWNSLSSGTVYNVELKPGVEDSHIWKLSSSGQYTEKLAYMGLFQGSVRLFSWERIWKTWALAKCRFFMCLVAHNRCWTADRLARRGLDHPSRCLLCDQDAETINYLLVDYVFARDFWFGLLQKVGMQSISPQTGETSFEAWWDRASKAAGGLARKGLNSHFRSLDTLESQKSLCVQWSFTKSK
jgi:hypothetical protein